MSNDFVAGLILGLTIPPLGAVLILGWRYRRWLRVNGLTKRQLREVTDGRG